MDLKIVRNTSQDPERKQFQVVGRDSGIVLRDFIHRYDAFDYIEHLQKFA